MESQYNQLLSTSKTVSAFYENVYGPVLQTLPWIDNGDGLKTASEKVLGNIAYPAWELSTYKNQKEDPQTIAKLRTRCNELDAIYKQMQNELRPLLNTLPAQERTWEKLQEMVPKWKNLNSSDLLPYSMHKAVEEHFAPTSAMIMSASSRRRALVQEVGPPVSTDEAVLGKIMAEKIRSLHDNGDSDHAIAMLFGSHGLWLDTGFLNRLR